MGKMDKLEDEIHEQIDPTIRHRIGAGVVLPDGSSSEQVVGFLARQSSDWEGRRTKLAPILCHPGLEGLLKKP
jgi:hypothetical protein